MNALHEAVGRDQADAPGLDDGGVIADPDPNALTFGKARTDVPHELPFAQLSDGLFRGAHEAEEYTIGV
jgi:hypothetical protein